MSEDAKLSSNLNNDMQLVYPNKGTLMFDRDGETVRWSSPREAGTQTGTVDTSRNQGGASSRTHKRECGRRVTAILGSKKMRTGFRGHTSNLKRKKGKKGGRRGAKLEAEEEGSDKTTVRLCLPPEKRAKKST